MLNSLTSNVSIRPNTVGVVNLYATNISATVRLLIKTIARLVLRMKSCIYESARNLYRGRRANPLQTFTTRQ